MQRTNTLLNRTLQAAVFSYQALAVAAFLAAIFLALPWIRTPFPGILTEATLVVNGAVPSGSSEEWSLYAQGAKPGDQIVAVKDTPVRSSREIMELLRGNFAGEDVHVALRKADGSTQDLTVRLNSFPSSDVTSYFILPMTIGLIFLVISL